MSEQISPCPFCGGSHLIGQPIDGAWQVTCAECCAEGSNAWTRDEAIRNWNRRVPAVSDRAALRAQFAAAALPAMIACEYKYRGIMANSDIGWDEGMIDSVMVCTREYADALLTELESHPAPAAEQERK